MNTCAAGTGRQNRTFGPVQLLDGKLAASAEAVEAGEEMVMDHSGILLTEALTVAHNAPDVRRDRIEAIRAQIENGTYEIDVRRLAENLIRENPDMFEE